MFKFVLAIAIFTGMALSGEARGGQTPFGPQLVVGKVEFVTGLVCDTRDQVNAIFEANSRSLAEAQAVFQSLANTPNEVGERTCDMVNTIPLLIVGVTDTWENLEGRDRVFTGYTTEVIAPNGNTYWLINMGVPVVQAGLSI